MKISIVAPVYNVENYLRESLESMLNQTLSDIEIIAVDDLSTDASLRILEEYAAKDKRLRIIRHTTNGTAAQCRKDGALASRGEYILFMDPDDILVPTACAEIYEAAKKARADVFHFTAEAFGEKGIDRNRIDYINKMLRVANQKFTGDSLYNVCFAEEKFSYQIWNKLFEGNMCRTAMKEFPDGCFPKAQDMMALYIILYFARSYVGVSTFPYYRYRVGAGVTGGNVLNRRQITGYAAQALVVSGLTKFMEEKGALAKGEKSLGVIRDKLFGDSMNRLANYIKNEDYPFAWDEYMAYWGPEMLVGGLAETQLDKDKMWAKRIAGARSMVWKPRKLKNLGIFYHSLCNGGTQRVVAELIKIWVDLGYNVTLFTDSVPDADDYAIPVTVDRVVLPALAPGNKAAQRQREVMLYREVRDRKIDFFLHNSPINALLLWDLLAVKSAGAAFYIHHHLIFSMLAKSANMLRPLLALPYVNALADGVVVLTKTDRLYWNHYNPNVCLTVNPLTYKLDEIKPNSLTGKTILWTGRISEEKNPLDLIEVMAIVHRSEPEARLRIVGSGSEKIEENMRKKTHEKGLEDCVEFCGFQQDLQPYYANADVFVCTSKYEGFCLTIVEAQSYGVPVVSYDMPYLAPLATGLGSVSVPQNDIKATAMEILKLLKDDEYRRDLGREARESVEKYLYIDFHAKWKEILSRAEQPCQGEIANAETRIMLDTLREHAGEGIRREHAGAVAAAKRRSGSFDDDYVRLYTEANGGVLPFVVPLPERGPCKTLRKKFLTLMNVLVLHGFKGVSMMRDERKMYNNK